MKRQQHSVAGGMNIGLQVAVAEGDRLLERVQAVLAMQIGLDMSHRRDARKPQRARRRTRSQRPSWAHCARCAICASGAINHSPGRRCSTLDRSGQPAGNSECQAGSSIRGAPQQAKKTTQKSTFLGVDQVR